MTTKTTKTPRSAKRQQRVNQWIINLSLGFMVFLWTVPTLGLLISSVRTREDIARSGWWTILPHIAWQTTSQYKPGPETDPDGPMTFENVTATFAEFREGVNVTDKQRVLWVGNKRNGVIHIQEKTWTANTNFTLTNYQQVMAGKDYDYVRPDGVVQTVPGDNFIGAFLNSVAVGIPATVIPILIAAFAAYGFAWMRFPGRRALFIIVIALLVVPLQIALVPILRAYNYLDINGTFLAVWLAHTGFGLPLATYLLYNYISGLPRETLESAFIDGASHFTVFTRLVLPLSLPALASFAIFQFLWVWNDYLVALIFIGSKQDVQVLTMRLAEIVGSRGADWHLLTAGAFVSMLLPVVVFFSLQRFFVRGLLAGSVKG